MIKKLFVQQSLFFSPMSTKQCWEFLIVSRQCIVRCTAYKRAVACYVLCGAAVCCIEVYSTSFL